MTLENIFLYSGAAGSVPGSGQLELSRGRGWVLCFPWEEIFLFLSPHFSAMH